MGNYKVDILKLDAIALDLGHDTFIDLLRYLSERGFTIPSILEAVNSRGYTGHSGCGLKRDSVLRMLKRHGIKRRTISMLLDEYAKSSGYGGEKEMLFGLRDDGMRSADIASHLSDRVKRSITVQYIAARFSRYKNKDSTKPASDNKRTCKYCGVRPVVDGQYYYCYECREATLNIDDYYV